MADFNTLRQKYKGYSDQEILGALQAVDYPGYSIEEIKAAVGYEPAKGDMRRGFETAFQQLPQLGYGLLAGAGAAAESAFGEGGIATGIKKAGIKGYQEWGDTVAANSRDTDSFSTSYERAKEGDIGALVDWLQYGLGYAGGQAVQLLAGAGVGTVAGKAALGTVAKTAAKGMVKKEAARIAQENAAQGGAKIAADELLKQATRNVAGKIGQTTAVAAQSFGMTGGEIFGGLTAENADRALTGAELGKAFGATLAAGGLEFAADKLGLDLILGKSKVLKPAESMTGFGGRAARAGLGLAAQMPVEGATEYLQTGIENFGKGQEASPFTPMQSDEARREAFDAAALGAVGGGAVGAVGGAIQSPRKSLMDIAKAPTVEAAIDAAVQATDVPLVTPPQFDADGVQLSANATPRQRNASLMAEIRQLEPEQQQEALGLIATAESPQSSGPVRRFAQNRLDELLLPIRQIPVGETVEEELLPTPETQELAWSEANPQIMEPPTLDQRRTMGKRVPVGEATEIIHAGDAQELEAIPAGEATELDPEVIQADDFLTADGQPYGTKSGAVVRARREGLGPESVVKVQGGWVARPQPTTVGPAPIQARPAGTRGTTAADIGIRPRQTAPAMPADDADIPALKRAWNQAVNEGRTADASAINDRIVAAKRAAQAQPVAPTPAAPTVGQPAEGASNGEEVQGQGRRQTQVATQQAGSVMPAGLRVTFGGKTFEVESVEDAQRKWVEFRDRTGAGVSSIGNGVRVTDGAGRFVARISYNGRAFDAEDSLTGGGNMIAEAPDSQPAQDQAGQPAAGPGGSRAVPVSAPDDPVAAQYEWAVKNRPSTIAVGLRGDSVPMAFQQRQQAQKMLDNEKKSLRNKFRIVGIGQGAGRRFYVVPTLEHYRSKNAPATSSAAPDAPAPTLKQRAEAMKAKRKGVAEPVPAATPVAEPEAPVQAVQATHKDPGEPAEPVTPAVVRDAIKTGVQATDRKPSAMKAELLAKIDEAIPESPDYQAFLDDVKQYGEKDAREMYAQGRRVNAAQFAPDGYSRPVRTFKIPGDGTFTINNTVGQLMKFRRDVEKSPGFSDKPRRYTADREPTIERGSGTPESAIRNMIDDGDPQAAVDYAAARGLDPQQVLKGDKVRLPKVAGLTPTAEQVGEFEAEAPTPDRRTNTARRKQVAEMTPDEMRRELLTDDLTGLNNGRWLRENEPRFSHIVAFDADSLKWVNDNMGHDSGDALLKAWGEALKQATPNAARSGGDEFFALANSEQEAQAITQAVERLLSQAVIEASTPTGDVIIRGIGASYGIGTDKKAADEALNAHKRAREEAGTRAGRGEQPPGTTRRLAQGEQDQAGDRGGQGAEAGAVEPNPLTLTPKQYHEATLRAMAESAGATLAEVREMYDTEAGRANNDQEWVRRVVEAAQAGTMLTRATLDKLLELRPTTRLPETAIPDGYQRPEARKAEAQAAEEKRQDRRERKQQAGAVEPAQQAAPAAPSEAREEFPPAPPMKPGLAGLEQVARIYIDRGMDSGAFAIGLRGAYNTSHEYGNNGRSLNVKTLVPALAEAGFTNPGALVKFYESLGGKRSPEATETDQAPEKAPMPGIPSISMSLARQAHAGTSFVPERRAEQERDSFRTALADAWVRAARIAGTDEAAVARITEVFNDVADGYAARYSATLQARSRVMSAMIAGPARFPVERNRKRMETERKRAEEAQQYLDRGIKRLIRAARGPIDNSPEAELERVRLNLQQREEAHETMKAANVALRKGDDAALEDLGFTAEQIAELKKPDFAGRTGFPAYKLSNNNAEIARLRERLKDAEERMAAAQAGPVEQERPGVKIVEDATDDRLRLIFDGKPSEEVRNDLKANGFKWSPKNEAWQRQLTGNAKYAAKQVLDKHYPAADADDGATLQNISRTSDRPVAAMAVATGKRSPLTGLPLFDVLDTDGNRIETSHVAKSEAEALQNYRERPARQAAARAAAPAPSYAMPEANAKEQGSNWRRVRGQEFTALDEDDGYLYHVTSAPRAQGVRDDGLVPNAGGMFGGFYANYSAGKVFLTERSGVSYWQEKVGQQLEAAMDNPPAVVVLRIPKEKVTASLLPDDLGTQDAGAPAYYATETVRNISRIGTKIASMGYKPGDVPNLQASRKLASLVKRLDEGKISEGYFTTAVKMLSEQMGDVAQTKAANRLMADRERGADIVREKLIRARRQGDLDSASVDFALWALDQNPAIADGLAISVRAPKDGAATGDYNPAASIMRVFKGGEKDDTAVHEIMHHTERMMPEAMQSAIRKEWAEALAKAMKAATPEQRTALGMIPEALQGDQAAYKLLVKAIQEGPLNYAEHYQLVNPSEYWAVNASRLLQRGFESKGSIWGKIRNYVADMIQKVKGLLGLRSDAPILKALDYLMDPANLSTEGTFRSPAMLSNTRAMAEDGVFEQAAYHGTRYRGIEKFSTDKIGTGEGAQAYGWGLYFASRKEIAEHYRETLTNRDMQGYANAHLNAKNLVARLNGDAEWAAETLADQIRITDPSDPNHKRLADTLEMVKSGAYAKPLENPGQLYEVEIPEDSELLLWDKPLSEQPEAVQRSIAAMKINDGRGGLVSWEGKSGEYIYQKLASSWGGQRYASEAMSSVGIKGIKYLDGTSRAAGDGSYNYVIFSGDDVAIQRTFYDNIQRQAKDQTKTEAFKRWFGDSKVVDADGKPLVVYHGTGKDFSEFDKGMVARPYFGDGFHFAETPGPANFYADRGGGNVMPVYLSIKNPYSAPNLSAEMERRGLNPFSRPAWEAFTEQLQSEGYDGLIYDDGATMPKGKGGKAWVAFRPEQIKSAIGNSGTFDPANPSILQNISRAAQGGASPLTAQDLLNAKGGIFKGGENKADRVRAITEGARPFWLGALTRDQIADIYGAEIPPVKDYDDLTRQMENERQGAAQRAEELYEQWAKIDADANDRLARIMLDATVAQVHPDRDTLPAKVTEEQRQTHARLRAQFKLLPKDAQAMYGKVRNFHANTLADLKTALEGRISRLIENGSERAVALADIRSKFDKYMEGGPYFPLHRFGDFLVIANRASDGERVVAAYENAGEQAAAARALEADGFAVKLQMAKKYNRAMDGSAGKFIGDVLEAINKMDLQEARIGASSTSMKDQLLDDLNQLFIRALPDLSYRKHFTHRKNTPGFSSDVMRGFASSAFHAASHIARLNHGDKMTFALEDAYKQIQLAPEGDFTKHSQVLDELARRHDTALNPDTSPLSAAATQVGFVMYLGLSPAAGLINMLQVPMVALPYIGARYGFGRASAAMARAYTDIMGAKPNAKSGFNAAQSPKLTADERRAISTLQDEGVIDLTQAHDLASATTRDVGNQARSKASFAIARAMRIVGWTFHVPEVMNRQVTALMAYRLEMAKSADEGKAMDAAREAIKRSQFDYSSSNRARYMQGNIARVVTQFRQFSQNMTYFLGRAAHQALKGESPEVRRIARQQLLSTFVVTGAMAGSLGLPGVSFVAGLVQAFVNALQGDDEEPWDWQTEYRNLLADQFGKEWGEVMARGVPRALMPAWDISNRVSLSDLWWRDSSREGENPRESFANDMSNILGPTAGTILGWYTAADHMQRGDYQKAVESIVPKFIRDPLKALRESQEGVTSYTGDPLMDLTTAELIGRFSGFAPARASEMFEGRNAVNNAKTALEERRTRLLGQMAKARISGDIEAQTELRERIFNWNRANPQMQITNMHIARSVMNRRRNAANTEQGIMLPDSREFLRDRARFAEVS